MNDNAAEIADLWERALDSLKASEKLLAEGFPDFAGSRAYYAAFYAATALLLSDGKVFAKHTGVRACIHRDYVRHGLLDTRMGKIYNSLYNWRTIGDYGVSKHLTAAEAQEAITDARCFVQAIEALMPPQVRFHD